MAYENKKVVPDGGGSHAKIKTPSPALGSPLKKCESAPGECAKGKPIENWEPQRELRSQISDSRFYGIAGCRFQKSEAWDFSLRKFPMILKSGIEYHARPQSSQRSEGWNNSVANRLMRRIRMISIHDFLAPLRLCVRSSPESGRLEVIATDYFQFFEKSGQVGFQRLEISTSKPSIASPSKRNFPMNFLPSSICGSQTWSSAHMRS